MNQQKNPWNSENGFEQPSYGVNPTQTFPPINQPRPQQYPGHAPSSAPGYSPAYASGYQQPVAAPAQAPVSNNNGLIIGLIVAVVILILLVIGIAAYFFTSGNRANNALSGGYEGATLVAPTAEDDAESAPATKPVQSTTTQAPQPTTSSRSERELAGGSLSDAWAGSSVTTQPFVESVHSAYRTYRVRTNNESGLIEAYSPVTGKTYPMNCRPSGENIVCTGGTNAVVYIGD